MPFWIPDPQNVGKTKELISDHHPQKLGDTIIWNIHKDCNLHAVAWSIAQQFANFQDVSSHMLQEVPLGRENELIQLINVYHTRITGQNVSLIYSSMRNGTHEFSNMTLVSRDKFDTNQAYTDIELNNKYQGQAIVSVIPPGNKGKPRVLVNVHAEFLQGRINIQQLFIDVKSKYPDAEIVIGGDFNKNPQALAVESGNMLPNYPYNHFHSTMGSNYSIPNDKKYAAPNASGVDAIFTSGFNNSNFALQRLDGYNDANLYTQQTGGVAIPGNPQVDIHYGNDHYPKAVVALTATPQNFNDTKAWVESQLNQNEGYSITQSGQIQIITDNPHDLMGRLSGALPLKRILSTKIQDIAKAKTRVTIHYNAIDDQAHQSYPVTVSLSDAIAQQNFITFLAQHNVGYQIVHVNQQSCIAISDVNKINFLSVINQANKLALQQPYQPQDPNSNRYVPQAPTPPIQPPHNLTDPTNTRNKGQQVLKKKDISNLIKAKIPGITTGSPTINFSDGKSADAGFSVRFNHEKDADVFIQKITIKAVVKQQDNLTVVVPAAHVDRTLNKLCLFQVQQQNHPANTTHHNQHSTITRPGSSTWQSILNFLSHFFGFNTKRQPTNTTYGTLAKKHSHFIPSPTTQNSSTMAVTTKPTPAQTHQQPITSSTQNAATVGTAQKSTDTNPYPAIKYYGMKRG